jgi:CheY-like chemotaxis protein
MMAAKASTWRRKLPGGHNVSEDSNAMTKSRTILYVEDDAVTLTAYRRRLEQAGFTVEPAVDGIQAMRYLHNSTNQPDLILLDLVLPNFDGEDVLKFIYDDTRLCRIPVIVLSTNSIVSVANEHLIEKAGQRLFKHTCTFQTLLQTIEKVLADAASATRTHETRPSACPATIPRILSLLQLNLRGVDPTDLSRTGSRLPPATA